MNLPSLENYNQLWKMRFMFDKLSDLYTTYCSPNEHLATDEITVIFRGCLPTAQKIRPKED
jgi:hypothetical protein